MIVVLRTILRSRRDTRAQMDLTGPSTCISARSQIVTADGTAWARDIAAHANSLGEGNDRHGEA
jgi:hypothetical protein